MIFVDRRCDYKYFLIGPFGSDEEISEDEFFEMLEPHRPHVHTDFHLGDLSRRDFYVYGDLFAYRLSI